MAIDHYNAFISYRHNDRDSAVASEIQSRLERFRIPPAVQKAAGIRKIDRIFRDKEELPITSDLGADIDEALSISDFLIVICSPELKESRWCMREIEVFLSSHPRQRVLTVVTEGEPVDVIPEVLLKDCVEITLEDGNTVTETIDVEPLACDYRKPAATRTKKDFRTAEREELPRLAAALIGCSYDELVRRQHQYRMRRMAVLGSLILALSAAAIAYLVWSRAQIRENYRQALISESRVLAGQSRDALNDEDRVTATALALSALPSPELERPVTAEAEYALTEALQIYSSSTAPRGTRILRARDDIRTFSYSADGRYLLAMDASGALTVWDVQNSERIAVWEIYAEEDLPSFAVLPDHRAIVWCGSSIFALDYVTGDQLWAQQLRYLGINAELSSDGKSVLVENRHDLYRFDCESGDLLSQLPLEELPEELSGTDLYFFGISASPSGDRAAVLVRTEGDASGSILCFWDPQENTLRRVSPDIYRNVLRFGFADDTHIWLCYRNGEEAYPGSEDTVIVPDDPVLVTMLDTGGKRKRAVWEASFDISQIAADCLAEPVQYTAQDRSVRNGILAAAGQTAVTLDAADGSIVLRRDLGSRIISFSGAGPAGFSAILSDGREAIASYEPSGISYFKRFAGGLTSFMAEPGTDPLKPAYTVLRDGELLIYETSVSPAYEPAEGDVTHASAMESVTACAAGPGGSAEGRTYIVTLTGDPAILITDTENRVTRSLPLSGTVYDWTLIGAAPDGSVIAARNDETDGPDAGLYFYRLDPSAEQPVPSLIARREALRSETGHTMFFSDFGKMFSMQDGHIWYAREDHLECLDAADGTLVELPLMDLADGLTLANAYRRDLISYGTLLLPPPVLASPGGETVFTVCCDAGDSLSHGLLIDTKTGESSVLEKLLYDGLTAAAFDETGERLAVSGNFLINVYDKNGAILRQISHPGRTVLSLCFHDGLLLALFSDGALEAYDPGALKKERAAASAEAEDFPSPISVTALEPFSGTAGLYEHFAWDFEDGRLFLRTDNDLFLVDGDLPSVQSARAQNCIGVTGGRIWNMTSELTPDGTVIYRAGSFPVLDVPALTMAGRELAGE